MSLLYRLEKLVERTIPTYWAKRIAKRQQSDLKNRTEVLALYRWFLKAVPQWYPRRLQRNAAMHEIQHMFRLGMGLYIPAQIQLKVQFAKHVQSKLQSGEWKQPPDYYLNFNRYPDHRQLKQQWQLLQ